MTHQLTRPRWLAGHVLVLVTVVAFVYLGFWQLRRHAEVQGLQAVVAESFALPHVEVGEAEMYRRAVAFGSFDHSREVRVLRSQDGVSGEVVLTPLVLQDGSAVLVNRGWVRPGESLSRPSGEIRTEGFMWPAESGSWLPSNLEPGQVVRRIDPAIIQAFVEYDLRDGYLIEALLREAEPPSIPSGPHLSYAVQWFLFTGVVLVGYPLLLRRVTRRGASRF
ncbi:MAG TPA: SURF1 family protein [Acidimicrobiia bacterium]|nr:SURF1 family protein [Acidimicrobiia bacterium]